MKRGLLLVTVFVLGCGTAQYAAGPEEKTLVDGFPSKPFSWQKRPGKNGRCDSKLGPPEVIVRGGGCWAWVVPTPEECVEAARQGAATVLEGTRCYYPILNTTEPVPTSSLLPDGRR